MRKIERYRERDEGQRERERDGDSRKKEWERMLTSGHRAEEVREFPACQDWDVLTGD